MRLRSVTLIATLGVIAGVGLSGPAAAATAPTISAPAQRTGFGPISITGHATPGATVTLIEAAYLFRGDMKPAVDYDTGGTVTAEADGAGHYTIRRDLDSGFVFAVEADGLRSPTITVRMQVLPSLTVRVAGTGSVAVHVAADPGQPGLPVQVQRSVSGTWRVQASGYTDQQAVFDATLTGQGSGVQSYRAYLGGDVLDALLPHYSVRVNSPAIPGPGNPPAARAGDVHVTKIVYNPSGTDTLNREYLRLTNTSTRTIDLRRWTVRDASGHVYTYATSYLLAHGGTTYLHSGKGTNGRPDSRDRYWGRSGAGGYVWDNTGDTATLRSSTGTTIDTCRYTAGGGTTYC